MGRDRKSDDDDESRSGLKKRKRSEEDVGERISKSDKKDEGKDSKKSKKLEKKEKKQAKKDKKRAKKEKTKAKKEKKKAKKKAESNSSSESSSSSLESSSIDELNFVMDRNFGSGNGRTDDDPENPALRSEFRISKALSLGVGSFGFIEREDDQQIAKEKILMDHPKLDADGKKIKENRTSDWICQRSKASGDMCNMRNFERNEKCLGCGGLKTRHTPTVRTQADVKEINVNERGRKGGGKKMGYIPPWQQKK